MTRPLAVARLVRLPNIFTAIADIAVGGAAALAAGELRQPFLLLALASATLYAAGMAWNDVFDRAVDAAERPSRPIPSGQISARFAARLGVVLTAGALVAAILAGRSPFLHVAVLLGLILAYDALLKSTIVGPIAMGLCRFANVLLGFSIVSEEAAPWHIRLLFAGVLGVYTSGITFLAHDEARQSRRDRLVFGMVLMVIAILGAIVTVPGTVKDASSWTVYILVGLVLNLMRPFGTAYAAPTPTHVQHAVKASIIGIIGLDAALAAAFVGPWALLVLLLLVPTISLGKRVYST